MLVKGCPEETLGLRPVMLCCVIGNFALPNPIGACKNRINHNCQVPDTRNRGTVRPETNPDWSAGVKMEDTGIWASHFVNSLPRCLLRHGSLIMHASRHVRDRYLARSPWALYQIASTHVPWFMPGSLTRGTGKTFPASRCMCNPKFYISGESVCVCVCVGEGGLPFPCRSRPGAPFFIVKLRYWSLHIYMRTRLWNVRHLWTNVISRLFVAPKLAIL